LLKHLNARQQACRFPSIGAYLSTLISLRTSSFIAIRHDYGELLFNLRTGREMIPYGICPKILCCHMAFFGSSRKEVETLHQDF
jgi:hypothetical protein